VQQEHTVSDKIFTTAYFGFYLLLIMPQVISSAQILETFNNLPPDPVFIFPTETIYGIGCSIASENAVARIFEIKGRDLRQPPPVLIAEREQLTALVKGIPASAQQLIDQYWPGSLTLVLPANDNVADRLCGISADGITRTIGVRHSAHPFAMELCRVLDSPVIATSANFSGAIGRAAAPQSLDDIPNEFKEKVDAIIDGGNVGGLPSTIVDCTGEIPRLLRAGAVTLPDFNN
jgi:L-threonylcarbamoyladenylate synthase